MSYYYVYDEFVQDPKFERELAKIENRLTDLGIAGKIARLALFRDASELIRDEVQKGANTVIAVGNDLTLRKVIDAAADSGVAIAVLPIGSGPNFIAGMLGMPSGSAACEIISARITQEMDTGVVNGRRFIHHCTIPDATGIEIVCDNKFTLHAKRRGSLEIRNFALADANVRAADPVDGRLELVIRTPERGWFGRKKTQVTVVPFKRLVLSCGEKREMFIDGESYTSSEFKIRVLPNHLKLITGKDRKF